MDMWLQLLKRIRRRVGLLRRLALLVLLAVPRLGSSQGTSGDQIILLTTNGVVLVTEVRPLSWGPSDTPPLLHFSLGFSTDETALPGEFLDSFSVTLETDNSDLTFLLLTIDAFGLVVAPPTPGTIPLDPGDVVATPIGFPSLQPVLANQFAFDFTAVLPDQLAGRNANIYFDLFNNQNSLQSLAWFSSEIRVPEPSVAALLLLGLGFGCAVRRYNK